MFSAGVAISAHTEVHLKQRLSEAQAIWLLGSNEREIDQAKDLCCGTFSMDKELARQQRDRHVNTITNKNG